MEGNRMDDSARSAKDEKQGIIDPAKVKRIAMPSSRSRLPF
jgi:hypothetical protein